MNAATDRAWCEFLDALTGRQPSEFARLALQDEMLPDEIEPATEDDDNWRDGSMRDGMRRARRERP